ncbi:alpha/beta hydrolase family protein [Roseateles sp. BYS78W]|uniref:Alpha/beta hydrolase family protein n=1 Tax=Pelomonas candidula TaxID=3299025 RepID=A0ABW7HI31_9BURK
MKTVKRWAGAIAGVLLFATCARAALPPAELFYKDADILEAVLSPSGRLLALTTSKGMPRVGMVVIDLAPAGGRLSTTRVTYADVADVRWVNDEQLVFSVTDLVDGSGTVDDGPGLFTVKADGSHFRQLVNRSWAADGGVSDPHSWRLSWNHRLVAVPPSQPGKVNEEVLLEEFGTDESDTSVSLMWLNVVKTTTRLVDDRQLPGGASAWMTDSLGQPRVAFTYDKSRISAYWLQPGSQKWSRLYESGLFDQPFQVEAIDGNGTLFVSRPQGPRGDAVLSRYDAKRGAPEDKPLVSTPGFDFQGFLVTGDAGKTLGVRVTVDGETTAWFDPAMKAFQDRVDTEFPNHVNRISCRRCGAPDMVALVRSYSDQDPGALYLFQAKPPEGQQNWQFLQAVRPDIAPAQMATLELQRVKARDGLELPVWITRPPGAKGPLPAVVLVHGGPWVRGTQWRWDADAQFLASRGYVVIEPEFRGSTGYGYGLYRAGFKQWGQAMQDDVADALLWAQQQGIASDKACIAGASYGGYSTLMGLVKHPKLYRCGVAWMAVTDMDLYVNGSWSVFDDIGESARKYSIPDLVSDATKDAAMIAANSPVKQAARIKAPVLLAFGEDDRRVPLTHGKRMRDALREAGNDPVWITYAGEGHGFGNVKNRIDFAERMAAFLAKHLQP